MLITFHGIDRPDSAGLRGSTRPAHLEFQSHRHNLLGGPLRDVDGNVCGTLIIFEAPDVVTARAEMADDPYIRVGLFEHISFSEFCGEWPADFDAVAPPEHPSRSARND